MVNIIWSLYECNYKSIPVFSAEALQVPLSELIDDVNTDYDLNLSDRKNFALKEIRSIMTSLPLEEKQVLAKELLEIVLSTYATQKKEVKLYNG